MLLFIKFITQSKTLANLFYLNVVSLFVCMFLFYKCLSEFVWYDLQVNSLE